MLTILTYLIMMFGLLNLIRICIFMIAADVYDVKNHRKNRHPDVIRARQAQVLPVISIIIPAYNEELTIEKTVRSVIRARYPHKEIIVVNDGSKDSTALVMKRLIKRYPSSKIIYIYQKNAGKGAALNRGIKRARGELVMVLDADSTIAPSALKNSVKYFEDPKVRAVASSVGLRDNGKWLGLVQRIEYLVAHRLKRSLTTLNIEYIIGGAGSIYRKSALRQVYGYRQNSITEDIDLSLKVVARGNKNYKVVFGADIHAKTEPVHSMRELISQRYRWKLGRLQSFVRYRRLFFSRKAKYSKLFTWYQLPYALFGEFMLFIEPFFIGTILYVLVILGDTGSLLTAMLIMSVYILFNIVAETDESVKNKLAMMYLLPAIYVMMPVLIYVELASLFKCLKNWRRIAPRDKTHGAWVHVKRAPTTS